MTEFPISKIEIRSKLVDGVKKYVVKGYAATAGNVYMYDGKNGKSLKECFTAKGIENITQKAKSEHIFVDYGHQTVFGADLQRALKDVEVRSGLNLSDEQSYLKDAFRIGDIPMFKVEDIKIDDNGLFVEIHGNPFYREADEGRQKYFDSVWNSLENGFINGMSLNMKPTEFIDVNEGFRQIDDADIFGISLLSGAANERANITEVAVRCCINRGEAKCQMRRKML